MTNDADRVRDIVGQMRVCADCARSSPDEFTYLNSAARPMLKKAANVIEAQSKALAEAREGLEVALELLASLPADALGFDGPVDSLTSQAVLPAAVRKLSARLTPTPENPNG